jgi:hypothetical protein
MRTAPTAFADIELAVFLAVEMEFDSGTERFWNGYGTVTIGGEEYYGAGDILGFSAVEEVSEIAARGVSITLSGLNTSMISAALQENYQNRPLTVYYGVIESGVYSTATLFKGRMDTMNIVESGETSTVEITAENRLIDLERARTYRYTSEDQKALYPNDLGLDFVADLQDKTVNWGRK